MLRPVAGVAVLRRFFLIYKSEYYCYCYIFFDFLHLLEDSFQPRRLPRRRLSRIRERVSGVAALEIQLLG